MEPTAALQDERSLSLHDLLIALTGVADAWSVRQRKLLEESAILD
jgi:hypothetical protein